ncbi:MAG: GNAT family N-acetyltransferase [Candidatus Paracaedibacteraceae bacterium]|nr:GNAT family N-acetyltransferase [Candidatus Paracaedibacteraceae bacterium]
MNYQIVPISEEYIEGYCKSVAVVSSERLFLSTFNGFSIKESRDYVLNNRKKGLPHFVVLDQQNVIGWCDISKNDSPIYEHSGVLGIGILKPYRGQGIGEKLIQKTLAAAKEIGLIRVELTVRDTNVNAIALYKKVGFEVEGILRKSVCVDGVYANHIVMAILFD